MRSRVLFVMGKWPNPSETFLAREMVQLARQGLDFRILAVQRNCAAKAEGSLAKLDERVTYLPGTLSGDALLGELGAIARHPARYLRVSVASKISFGPGLVWRLAPILATARTLGEAGFTRVHGQFASLPARVAWALARWLDVPFSFSCHARDLYVADRGLRRLVHDAQFVVTCTEHNLAYLRERFPQSAARFHRVYHGVETGKVKRQDVRTSPPMILALGRLVEKKGFAGLLQACAVLRDHKRDFRCEILGEGPLRADLSGKVQQLGLEERITLAGWCGQSEVAQRLSRAACLLVPSRIASDGDRDGIPNVILEAMASGCPVVATDVSGIPEVVIDGETGLLVPPGDATALADAIERMMDDRRTAETMAQNARKLVTERFDPERNAGQLMELLTRNG